MSKNCLVTKLSSVVDNNNILKLGEFRFHVTKVNSPTAATQGFYIKPVSELKATIIGDGYFTDSNLHDNKGVSMSIPVNGTRIYVSNGDFDVSIVSKYDMRVFENYDSATSNIDTECINKIINIDNLIYSGITTLNLKGVKVEGYLNSLANIKRLMQINLSKTSVIGDLDEIRNLTSLIILNLGNSYGISGDLSSLVNLINLSELILPNTVHGDISSLANMSKLAVIDVKDANHLYGDLAVLPDSLSIFSNQTANSKFTWTSTNRRYILSLEHINCDAIDTLLIDMSTKEVHPSADYKMITLIGTRTSASDAAIQTLQSKGYTVSITPA